MPDPAVSETRAARSRRRAALVKERIYVAFTALAVVIVLERDSTHQEPGRAALVLGLTVAGTLLAMFVAELIAHVVSFAALPGRAEVVRMLVTLLGAVPVVVAPLLLIAAAAAQLLPVDAALRAGAIVLVATLAIVTLIAVGRLAAAPHVKLVVLAAAVGLGGAVLWIELAAH